MTLNKLDSFEWERIDHPEYKYRLTKSYVVFLPELAGTKFDYSIPGWVQLSSGWFTLTKGYCWNGTSGPTFESDTNRRGSAVHDGLYQGHRLGLLAMRFRRLSDRVFRWLCLDDEMHPARACVDYVGLRLGGWWAAHPR